MKDSDVYAPSEGDSSYHISETIDKWHFRENKKVKPDSGGGDSGGGSDNGDDSGKKVGSSNKVPIIIGTIVGLIIVLIIVILMIRKCKQNKDPYMTRTYTEADREEETMGI